MPPGTRGDYEVGYGKPPLNAGFLKGQSGNPRGRPPGSKNLTTLLNDALNRPVTNAYRIGHDKDYRDRQRGAALTSATMSRRRFQKMG